MTTLIFFLVACREPLKLFNIMNKHGRLCFSLLDVESKKSSEVYELQKEKELEKTKKSQRVSLTNIAQ